MDEELVNLTRTQLLKINANLALIKHYKKLHDNLTPESIEMLKDARRKITQILGDE